MTPAELALQWERLGDIARTMRAHYLALEDDRTPTEPLWVQVARAELGVAEYRGGEHNPRIVEYHGATRAGEAPDEVPWCSSFVNWCFLRAGIAGTGSKAARSWEQWGVDVDAPTVGCVVVLSRGPNPAHGHVGFYVGPGARGTLRLLGGNQGNRVSIQSYPLSRVLSYRVPGATR